MPELTGLSKTRIERRLEDAGKEAMAAAAGQTGADNGKYIDITLAPGVVMRLVKIPASEDGKIKEFYLGQTEVTQKQWQAVMGSNPSKVKGDEFPVTNVSLDEAKAFCDRLGGHTEILDAIAISRRTRPRTVHRIQTHSGFSPQRILLAEGRKQRNAACSCHEVEGLVRSKRYDW